MCYFYATAIQAKIVETKRERALRVGSLIVLFFSVIAFAVFELKAQNCVTSTIMQQIEFACTPDAVVPQVVEEWMNRCAYTWSIWAALFLGLSSLAAAVLGATFSNRFLAGHSTSVSAHYESDTRRLVLRFDRPTVAQNPQRMVLLYRHADGMAAAVPGQQCGNSGLTLAFTTDIEKPPTHMELVVCSGAMHPAGFPESDVCTGDRPIHVDVDILYCDTKG